MSIRRVNHVVLSVSDIEASTRFYADVLGLRVIAELPRTPTWPAMVFLRSPHRTTNHHDIGLIENATSAAEDLSAMVRPGLFHVALEVGTLDELEGVRDQLEAANAHQVSLDQGMHLSVYGRDPDGISVEIIWRAPEWSAEDEMYRVPLDFAVAPRNWRRAYVVDASNHVWRTFNGGRSWRNLTRNLNALTPSLKVASGAPSLRTAAIIGLSERVVDMLFALSCN